MSREVEEKIDYYEVLGLCKKTNYTDEEIKKVYLKLAKEWHPDLNQSPEAKLKFQRISNCYDLLKDASSRARYLHHKQFTESTNNIRYNSEVGVDASAYYNHDKSFFSHFDYFRKGKRGPIIPNECITLLVY